MHVAVGAVLLNIVTISAAVVSKSASANSSISEQSLPVVAVVVVFAASL
jgi:hypothetical protein